MNTKELIERGRGLAIAYGGTIVAVTLTDLCNALESSEADRARFERRRGGECCECGSWVCPPLTCISCSAGQSPEGVLRRINGDLTDKLEASEAMVADVTRKGEQLCEQNGTLLIERHDLQESVKAFRLSADIAIKERDDAQARVVELEAEIGMLRMGFKEEPDSPGEEDPEATMPEGAEYLGEIEAFEEGYVYFMNVGTGWVESDYHLPWAKPGAVDDYCRVPLDEPPTVEAKASMPGGCDQYHPAGTLKEFDPDREYFFRRIDGEWLRSVSQKSKKTPCRTFHYCSRPLYLEPTQDDVERMVEVGDNGWKEEDRELLCIDNKGHFWVVDLYEDDCAWKYEEARIRINYGEGDE